MRRVSIFGVGLIGGSFALALRQAGFDGEIRGVSSPKTIETALALNVIDRGIDIDSAVATSDLIYIAQPISVILETVAALGPKLRPGTVVTDAGSTKKQIVERACGNIQQSTFIGGHPMAGKERAGVQQADADLFRDRPYVLCPCGPGGSESKEFQEFQDLIVRIGARPVMMEAAEHDRLVAFTSHVPQLLSTALSSVLSDIEGAELVAGPAIQELTRIGMSPFHIWRDILHTNESCISAALSELLVKLQALGQTLGSEEMALEFEKAASGAQKMRSNRQKRPV